MATWHRSIFDLKYKELDDKLIQLYLKELLSKSGTNLLKNYLQNYEGKFWDKNYNIYWTTV